jgi:CheY-like chemotaxis protein
MSSGRVILVVEDNAQNLELVEYLLEEAGLEVRRAMDADAAWEVLEQEVPDLILMDMQLPGTDGLTLASEIRQREALRGIPIIALTAHAMRGDRERFLAGGCDGYISKPIKVATFVDDVRGFLRSAKRGGE